MFSSNDVTSAYQELKQQMAMMRTPTDKIDPILFPNGGPKAGSLIEIRGPANSGKTLLLTHIMARYLPPTHFGGRYADVLLLDLRHKICLNNFRKQIERIILESKEKCATVEEYDEIVNSCLESVMLLDCYSLDEFQLSLDVVETQLMQNRYINFVFIDNIDAFYWEEAERQLLRMRTYHTRLTKQLRALSEKHNVCCAYTIDANFLKNKNSGSSFSAAKPEHIFQLNVNTSGLRSINGKPFTIVDAGMHFT